MRLFVSLRVLVISAFEELESKASVLLDLM
jgi:hypothetical protein